MTGIPSLFGNRKRLLSILKNPWLFICHLRKRRRNSPFERLSWILTAMNSTLIGSKRRADRSVKALPSPTLSILIPAGKDYTNALEINHFIGWWMSTTLSLMKRFWRGCRRAWIWKETKGKRELAVCAKLFSKENLAHKNFQVGRKRKNGAV